MYKPIAMTVIHRVDKILILLAQSIGVGFLNEKMR